MMEADVYKLGTVVQHEDLVLFRMVFESILKTLPPSMRTLKNQTKIAQHILDCAATGERDPVELRIAGLVDFERQVGRNSAA